MGGNRSRIPPTGKRGEQDGRAGGSCEQQNEPARPKWLRSEVVRDVIVREAGSFVYSPDLFLSRLALPTHTAEPPSQVCAVVLVILSRGSVFYFSVVQSLFVPVSDERGERATARRNNVLDRSARGPSAKREGVT